MNKISALKKAEVLSILYKFGMAKSAGDKAWWMKFKKKKDGEKGKDKDKGEEKKAAMPSLLHRIMRGGPSQSLALGGTGALAGGVTGALSSDEGEGTTGAIRGALAGGLGGLIGGGTGMGVAAGMKVPIDQASKAKGPGRINHLIRRAMMSPAALGAAAAGSVGGGAAGGYVARKEKEKPKESKEASLRKLASIIKGIVR